LDLFEDDKYFYHVMELFGNVSMVNSSSSSSSSSSEEIIPETADLFSYLEHIKAPMPEPYARKIFEQILSAVNYLRDECGMFSFLLFFLIFFHDLLFLFLIHYHYCYHYCYFYLLL